MIKRFLKRQVKKNRDLILSEGRQINDFMRLLMKHRNTGNVWTKAEISLLKDHLKHLSLFVPALIIFAMPLGSLLIPLLAEILDRRNEHRTQIPK